VKWILSACTIAAASCTLPAAAQDAAGPPDAVDLAAVVRLVKEGSPRYSADLQSVAIAEAERIGAAALPNPTLNYNYQRPNGGGNLIVEIGAEPVEAGLQGGVHPIARGDAHIVDPSILKNGEHSA